MRYKKGLKAREDIDLAISRAIDKNLPDCEDYESEYQQGGEDMLSDVFELIEQDINFQKTRLENDFEKDKAINWRIQGLEWLKEKLEIRKDGK